MPPKILIAEDEERMRKALAMLLSNMGYKLQLAKDGVEAFELFENDHFDVVITDLKMPRMNGYELLKKIREINSTVPIIIITAFGTIESAVEAMQSGAIDYITKPFEEEKIKLTIEKALEIRKILDENKVLKNQIAERYNFQSIIAESPEMKKVIELAKEVSQSNSTVLILGESGTGKELLTRAIHLNSPRAGGPFVPINCAAIPDTLLESELFGHEKGSFTGAIERKMGKFELSTNGTLFLDEIAEMSLPLQAKILRATEEKTFERIGGLKPIKCDIRFIIATNKNLLKLVNENKFREDLYYRISVFPILIPPLRERKSDIMPLTKHFLEKYCKEIGKHIPTISKKAEEFLLNQKWEGNVRELQNIIERAVILLKGDTLTPELLIRDVYQEFHQLESTQKGNDYFPFLKEGFSLEEYEKSLILKALEISNYNKSKAAKILGISRATLRYRLEKYNIINQS